MRHLSIPKTVFLLLLCACGTAFAQEAPALPDDRPHIIAGMREADPSNTPAIQPAALAALKGVECVFPYLPDNIYQIYLQPGFVTDIRLPKGEKLKYVGAGDTSRWLIDNATNGAAGSRVTHVFIKPVQEDVTTNLIINTDKRTYNLMLISGKVYNPMVSWIIPKSVEQKRYEETEREYGIINPKDMDFRYKVSNTKYAWSPQVVFNSASKTYLKMKPEIVNSEMPAFFIVDDDKKNRLVGYRFVKGYMVIDRLFDKAVLVLGQKKVEITRKGA